MWPKAYKDYPKDTKLKKDQVEPSHGIIGCEMHDINGWGDSHHQTPQPKRKGFFRTLWNQLFSNRKRVS